MAEGVSDDIEILQTQPSSRKLSSAMVAFNVFSIICSISNMGFPYAFLIGGWTAVVSTIFLGFITAYTCELLGQCLYDRVLTKEEKRTLSRKTAWKNLVYTRETLASVGECAYPRFGKNLVVTCALIELIGTVILYLLLMGTSVAFLANYFGFPQATVTVCTVIMGGIAFPLIVIPSMRVVSTFSIIAVTCLFPSLIIVAIGCGIHLLSNPIQWDFLFHLDPRLTPVAFGIIVFTFGVHPILPSVERTMRSPHNYPIMIRFTFAAASFIKIAFGLFCAMTYGVDTMESISHNITDQTWILVAANFTVTANVLFSVPLIFSAIGGIVDELLESYNWNLLNPNRFCGSLHYLWLIGTRGGILSLCVIVGILVPHFALIMALIGSFTGSMVCFVFPALFHYEIFKKQICRIQKAVNIAVAAFGVITCIICVSCSAAKLISVFSH